jgi:hypothetical protein
MAIKTSSAKGKGRNHQNNIRDVILGMFSWLGEGDVDSCSMGSSGVDIPMSPLGRKTLPISIEAKKTRKHPAKAEMAQARANAYEDTIAAVVWSPHGSGQRDTMITFNWEDFIEWYCEIRREHLDTLREKEETK